MFLLFVTLSGLGDANDGDYDDGSSGAGNDNDDDYDDGSGTFEFGGKLVESGDDKSQPKKRKGGKRWKPKSKCPKIQIGKLM